MFFHYKMNARGSFESTEQTTARVLLESPAILVYTINCQKSAERVEILVSPLLKTRATRIIVSYVRNESPSKQATQKLATNQNSCCVTTAFILCYQPARSKRLPPDIRVAHEGKKTIGVGIRVDHCFVLPIFILIISTIVSILDSSKKKRLLLITRRLIHWLLHSNQYLFFIIKCCLFLPL